ncbi:MAG: Riboflavin synthase [Chlamydiales bacterium]|nr:Riboflavin synthase [Chlamydiales bacterium]
MFTGIIQTIGTVIEVIQKKDLLSYALDFPHDHLQLGASVSVDGVCQTVVHMEGGYVWFDAIAETLKRTTLETLTVGQKVNIERAAKIGDEIGGHLLSGHIYGTARLHQVEGNIYTFECPTDCMKYLFSKGFIAIDGISLTLVQVEENFFTVHLIPETLKRTTLATKKVNERINLELDSLTQAVVETVERMTTSG